MEKTASEIVTVKKNVRLQEWNRQIEEQKASGLSVQKWCIQNGINLKTYYYHLRKVREEFLRSGKSENTQAQIEAERSVVPIIIYSFKNPFLHTTIIICPILKRKKFVHGD